MAESVIVRKVANFANFVDENAHLSTNPTNLNFCTSMMRSLPTIMIFNWITTNCKGKTPDVVIADFLEQFFISQASVPKEGMDTLLRYARFFIDIANQL